MMDKYIGCEALLNALKEERKNGNFVFTSKWIKEIIDNLPSADVVPKSEVENLRKKLEEKEVELMNVCLDKTNCDDMIQYILDFYFKQRVKDVFEEIEFEINQLDFDRDETRSIAIEGIITNAKKKYTEDNNDG